MSPIASLIEVVLSVLTMVAAGFSAWLWIRASRVPIPPFDNWRGGGAVQRGAEEAIRAQR